MGSRRLQVGVEESGFLAGARGPGFAGGGGDAGQGEVVGCRSVSVDELRSVYDEGMTVPREHREGEGVRRDTCVLREGGACFLPLNLHHSPLLGSVHAERWEPCARSWARRSSVAQSHRMAPQEPQRRRGKRPGEGVKGFDDNEKRGLLRNDRFFPARTPPSSPLTPPPHQSPFLLGAPCGPPRPAIAVGESQERMVVLPWEGRSSRCRAEGDIREVSLKLLPEGFVLWCVPRGGGSVCSCAACVRGFGGANWTVVCARASVFYSMIPPCRRAEGLSLLPRNQS